MESQNLLTREIGVVLDLNVLWYLQKTRRGSNLINKVEYMERKLAILNTVENGLQLANAARGSVNIGFRRALSGSVDKAAVRTGPCFWDEVGFLSSTRVEVWETIQNLVQNQTYGYQICNFEMSINHH